MKIIDLLRNPELKNKKVLEKLIAYYLNIQREQIFTNYENEIDEEITKKIIDWFNQFYYDKKPLEFILWFVEFFGNKFELDSRTLIPRPETEYMIKAVNEHLNELKDIDSNKALSLDETRELKVNLIDVGTWCWVLWLSTIIFNKNIINKAILCDLSSDALEVAKNNYIRLTNDFKNIEFIESNLVNFLIEWKEYTDKNRLIIVANLPYIPDDMFDENVEENVKKWEPRMAFVWWNDWLDLYRIMFSQLFDFNSQGKINIIMFLEMMTWQVEILRKEFWEKICFEEVETFHFNIRIVKATLK